MGGSAGEIPVRQQHGGQPEGERPGDEGNFPRPEPGAGSQRPPQAGGDEQRGGRADVRTELGEPREQARTEKQQEPGERLQSDGHEQGARQEQGDERVGQPVEADAVEHGAADQRDAGSAPSEQRVDHHEGQADGSHEPERSHGAGPPGRDGDLCQRRHTQHQEGHDHRVGEPGQQTPGHQRDGQGRPVEGEESHLAAEATRDPSLHRQQDQRGDPHDAQRGNERHLPQLDGEPDPSLIEVQLVQMADVGRIVLPDWVSGHLLRDGDVEEVEDRGRHVDVRHHPVLPRGVRSERARRTRPDWSGTVDHEQRGDLVSDRVHLRRGRWSDHQRPHPPVARRDVDVSLHQLGGRVGVVPPQGRRAGQGGKIDHHDPVVGAIQRCRRTAWKWPEDRLPHPAVPHQGAHLHGVRPEDPSDEGLASRSADRALPDGRIPGSRARACLGRHQSDAARVGHAAGIGSRHQLIEGDPVLDEDQDLPMFHGALRVHARQGAPGEGQTRREEPEEKDRPSPGHARPTSEGSRSRRTSAPSAASRPSKSS